jgi:hypothetical protein
VAAVTGGAVAAVVGCTALAASFLGELSARDDRPSQALPDGARVPVRPEPTEPPEDEPEDAEEPGAGGRSPVPEETGTGTPPDPTTPGPEPSPSTTGTGGPSGPDPGPEPGHDPEPDPAPGGPEPSTPPPTAFPSPTPDPTDDPTPLVLREGDKGPEVVELQQRLAQISGGIYEGEAHGRYDAKTREAVATFQIWYGVQGDEEGVYGPNTRARLEETTTEP